MDLVGDEIMETTEIEVHPVQTADHKGGRAPQVVTMRAYEVYCHVYSPQKALVTGGCRGGFSAGELIAYLYAYSFPREQWRSRVTEACHGMVNL